MFDLICFLSRAVVVCVLFLRAEKLVGVWFGFVRYLAFGSIQSILLASKFLDLLPWLVGLNH
jgi:hypothetical protein